MQGLKNRNYIKLLSLFTLAFITIITHRNWFLNKGVITSGDWGFYFIETMNDFLKLPHAWNPQQNLGTYPVTDMSFYGIKVLFGFFSLLGIPFSISERILFLWPIAIISVIGMYYLSFKLFNNHLTSFFASILYSLNTYFLIIETGHLTVAMAYSLAPLIIAFFMNSLNKECIRSGVITGLIFSLAFFYEPRISYIISLIIFIYVLVEFVYRQITRMKLIITAIPFVIVFLIHSYWIIPYIFGASSALNTILPMDPWISWMNILNSFTLLHPFWTGGAASYFIIQPIPVYMFAIPLLAFSSLLLKNKENEKIIMFFSLLGLLGIFLVKQENAPFGQAYTWLFHNFPGFNMFREASKFYLLIALSYSILIGYSIHEIYNKISYFKSGAKIKYIFILIVLILLLFPAKPAFTNELGETFKKIVIPSEYVQLKDYFHDQEGYFRTFWYPSKQRFGYYSNNHPEISGIEMFFGNGALIEFMPQRPKWTSLPENSTLNNILDILSVKYIVIPFDSENEVYKYYSPKNTFIQNIEGFSWLSKEKFSENITIYNNSGYMDHFFSIFSFNQTKLENRSSIKDFDKMRKSNIEYQMINPTEYIIKIQTSEPFTLAFSEAYDPNWAAIINGTEIKSFPLFSTINGFEISEIGNYELTMKFKLQSYVNIGFIISVITLILCGGYLMVYQFKKSRSKR